MVTLSLIIFTLMAASRCVCGQQGRWCVGVVRGQRG